MIIFLYGPNSFLAHSKLDELKNKFIKEIDATASSLSFIDGANINLEKINEQVSASSLFVKKRMIVIDGIFSNKDQGIFDELLEFLKKREKDDNIIIFCDFSVKTKKIGSRQEAQIIGLDGREKSLPVKMKKIYDFLSKQKYAQEFKNFSARELEVWIKKEVENRGGKIEYRAANLLASLVGDDLWQLNNEINKLVHYKSGHSPQLVAGAALLVITEQDVEELARGKFNQNIFALTDAISAKNKAQALILLEKEFASGTNDIYLLTMILRQFKILLRIRQALDSGSTSKKIISLLKIHPFVAQKGINQVRNFSLPQLKKIISSLVEAERDLKTGRTELSTALDLILVSDL